MTIWRHSQHAKAFATEHGWGYDHIGGFASGTWWFRLPPNVTIEAATQTIGDTYIIQSSKTTMSGVNCLHCHHPQ